MAHRVILKKKWKNMFGKEYRVGTILQLTSAAASELIRLKYAEEYDGKYPPKEKQKINLSQLNKLSNGDS